jgi:thymidylate kinase
VLRVVGELAKELNEGGIRYCHWKSNWALGESVCGEGDLDLLVHREDATRFRAIAERSGFRPVVDAANPPFPAVEHLHAMDPDSAAVAHVHAYYRVVTGQSLVKNYRLPVEAMLLENAREEESSVRVPLKGAELIVFTVRMLLKHTSPFELVLLRRQWKRIRAETAWLLDDSALESARELLPNWLPQLDVATFERAVRALEKPASLGRRIALGYRIRRRLRAFTRHGAIRAQIVEVRKFLNLLSHRLRGSKKGLTPVTGGAVIAFVGSEASGKSTLANEMRSWLRGHYTVERIHAGKPPGTPLTLLPNLLVPLMRRVVPSSRSTAVEARIAGSENPSAVPAMFALRSVSLAWDRRAVLLRAHAKAANGRIVLCDRYPSEAGTIDGPQLASALDPSHHSSWLRWLARLEARLYADIPPPDLVIYLSAPLDTTLARNLARDKTEPDTYVRKRHARSADFTFDNTAVCRISTDRPLSETVREVKLAVWKTL